MATTAPATNSKGHLSLISSIGLMIGVPTFGLLFGSWLLDTYPDLFGRIWSSRYDVGGRLWLLASFLSTLLITGTVVSSFIVDKRFDCVRSGTNFSFYAKSVIGFVIVLPILGIAGFFLPASWGGVWWMKGLALVTAVWMWVFDAQMLKIVNEKDQSLQKTFYNTVRLIDRPTTGAVALVMILVPIYLRWILPGDAKYVIANESFVMGLSSGAVAVELWFANLLFWLVERETA